MNPGFWSEDRSNKLAGYVAGGAMSYSRITEALNQEFSSTYSRNAVIGRAMRMGLCNPYQIKKVKAEPKPKVHRQRQRYSPESRRVLTIFENAEQVKLRCVEIVPLHIPLMDLEPDQCRYVYGDGPFTFCGHPRFAPFSYCAPHKHLAIVAPQRITEEERERRRLHARRNHRKTLLASA